MTRTALRGPTNRGTGGLDLRAGVPEDALIGRLEEWIVSTLDDRSRPSSDLDSWRESLGHFTPTKRTAGLREAPSSTRPASHGGWARFRLSRGRGIAVVSLTDQALIKEEDLLELTGDLAALVEAGHRRVVLDFSAVERLSSWASSAIDGAIRACYSTEGSTLKVSGLRPELAAIFAMTGLDPRVAVYPDIASAIGGHWPALPELRALPVSILAALLRAEDARPSRSARARSRRRPRFRPHAGPSDRSDEEFPAMIDARLIVQDGPWMGKPIAIRGETFVIGRGPGCQLRVGSRTVSRSHATISRRAGRLFLRDLASTNGSLLNGRPVLDGEVEVRDGDRLQVGPMNFTLSVGPAIDRANRFEGSSRPLTTADADFEDHPDATEEHFDLETLGESIGLKHEVIEGTLVVTPLASGLDEASEVDPFRDALISLYERKLPRRVVVNLTHVGHVSGRAIGVLVAHHLRLDRSGGALRVCLANPRVALVLEQVKLGMLVDYHSTVDEAILAAWPEPVSALGRA